jgi:cytochrome c553
MFRWSRSLSAVAEFARIPMFVLTALLFPLYVWADDKKLTPAQLEFFEKSVRPVLSAHCFECHGEEKQRGGLRLDSRAAMMDGGDTGPAIVANNPKDSLLVKAISYQDERKMPPKAPLAPEHVAALTAWIQQGAFWPEGVRAARIVNKDAGFQITPEDRAFWSFQPLKNAPVPSVKNTAWPRGAIDRFVLAKLEASGLAPAPAADPRTLLRRVYFDLIGLPPEPEEVEDFVRDCRRGTPGERVPSTQYSGREVQQAALAEVVDRLLNSPRYGERWARHWLDVARYGEDQAHTFQARKYPHGFRYRDWLIRAFNEDMPYDRFVMEQIAGDLLHPKLAEGTPAQKEQLAALGFFALGPVYYGDRLKLDQIDDRIDTLTRGFLGLTVACARCHDHKYDPISTRDYYSLAGVFHSTDYEEVPLIAAEEVQRIKDKQTAEEKKKKAPPKYPVVHSLKEGKPANLAVHIRGNPKTLGDEAPRGFLTILSGEKPTPFQQGSGRLELARAIASKDNPLTARVMVNRIWQHHFGKGLVRTPSNFGELGERPTHPELLDWLAARFIESGWSIKKLHRDIIMSAVYQQASGIRNQESGDRKADANAAVVDADNRLLWRMNRRRLEVEAWRDAMLTVAGTLDQTVGGPSSELNAPDNRRRTLYGSVSRHDLNPLLRLFDFPDPNITSDERTLTTVPLQQLFVLNSEFMVRNAKALATRLENIADDDERIRHAFALVYGRPATQREIDLAVSFLSQANGDGIGLSRWEQYAQVLLSANEFLYVD